MDSSALLVTVRGYLARLTPQGWAFFTRDAQLEQFIPYRWDFKEGVLKPLVVGNRNWRVFFGLDRIHRIAEDEANSVSAPFLGQKWKTCRANDANCLAYRPEEAHRLEMEGYPHPVFCGPVVMRRHFPKPLEWVDLPETDNDLWNVIYLDIKCDG